MKPKQEEIFDSKETSRKKSRLGIIFFFIYTLFYSGFVIIGVFNYELMVIEYVKGVNLAILYGFGLIFLAIVMGILYNFMCTRYEDRAQENYENEQNVEL